MVKFLSTLDHDMKRGTGGHVPATNRSQNHCSMTTLSQSSKDNTFKKPSGEIGTISRMKVQLVEPNENHLGILSDNNNITGEQLPNEQKDRNCNKRTKQYLIPY